MKSKDFIIICLFVTCFVATYAQDLSKLSEAQKQLLNSYKENKSSEQGNYYYESQTSFYKEPTIEKKDITQEITAKQSVPKSEIITREDLLPFGLNPFKSNGLGEVPIGIASASDYILGPGDNIIIYIWGRVDKEIDLTFDRDGNNFVPSTLSGISVMGAVGVNGRLIINQAIRLNTIWKILGDIPEMQIRKQARLIYANGKIISGGIENKKVELGSIIVVPNKINKEGNKFYFNNLFQNHIT